MNKYAAILALGLAACGDTQMVFTDEFATGADAGPELGQTAQALTLLDGYGSDGLQNRCWHNNHTLDWGGGRCNVPGVRKLWINVQGSGCNGLGNDALNGIKDGVHYVRGLANNRGWTVLTNLTSLSPGNGPYVQIDLDCGVTLPGQGPGQAATQITAGPGTCQATQDGDLCKYTSGKIRIVPGRISATPGWSAATGTQKRTFMYVITAHEMGHAVGLGHDACGNDPLAQLMGNGACVPNDVTQVYATILMPFELDMLAAYRP